MAMRDPNLLGLDKWTDGLSPAVIFVVLASMSTLVSLLAFRLGDGMSRFFSVHDFIAICGAVATSVGATSFFMFTLTRLEGIPRSTPAIFAFVLTGSLVLGRAFHRVVVTELDKVAAGWKPDQLRNIVIVGVDQFSLAAVRLVQSQVPTTARVLALIDEDVGLIGRAIRGVRVVAQPHELDSVLREYEIHGVTVDQVVISDRSLVSTEARETLRQICDQHEIETLPLSDALNLAPKSATNEGVASVSAHLVKVSPYFKIKRVLDVSASFALIVLLSPLIIVVSGLVLIDVGMPLLFWQERIGYGGRRFLLRKFRTYAAPFDRNGVAIPAADQLSRLGKFMRATRFDEIPQLLNILVGDMSLIGPRPLLPKDQPADPSIRLLARPGITGWAQINGGNSVTPEEKEALDAWYVEHATPLVDMKILAHSLIIAATGERFDRAAIAQALKWRGGLMTKLDSASTASPTNTDRVG
ncbi:MAG: sugar transferase [Methylobacteriaceae bacterium]|nr:sugar transferase [Methylobacteriaceae bacterium]